jgi:phage tail-like protein
MNLGVPDIPRPPHDPLFTVLDARVGWRGAHLEDVEFSDGSLQLNTPPPAQQNLADGIGAFGGLTLPTGSARDAVGTLFRVDPVQARLERFDTCTNRFEVVPCTGGVGSAPRQLREPHGLAWHNDTVYVCDTGNERIQVFSVRGWVLRAIWNAPTGSSWEPFGIAVDAQGQVFVTDRHNGRLLCFDRQGRVQHTIGGLQRPTHITIDRAGRIYVVQDGLDDVAVFEADGSPSEPTFVRTVTEVKKHFCPVPLDDSVPTKFAVEGTFLSEPLDSTLEQCVWHRVEIRVHLPRGTRLRVDTYTSDTDFGPTLTADSARWVGLPAVTQTQDGVWDALIVSPPGRFLWLRLRFTGHGTATPQVTRIKIEYPRLSLRRWLPAVFGANPRDADFTDRLLAVFDTMFRGLEGKLDSFSRCLDPRGAPVSSRSDWLAWLASWLDLTLDRTWPTERRRRWLLEASALYHHRGTTEGLRRQLLLLLGWLGPTAQAPTLILEHYKLRRWLFVGQGRLGEQAVLWGEQLLGCPTATGDVRLNTSVLPVPETSDTTRTEFHAYRFTVFVPQAAAADVGLRAALERVIALHKPAHALCVVEAVASHGRIGKQCSIGLNTVVGRYPEDFHLSRQRLGQDTVLQGENSPPTLQVGTSSRVGSTTVLS